MKLALRLACLALALIVLAAPWAQAAETFKEVLPNGLTVIIRENHSSPVVNLRFYVKSGSIHEGKYLDQASPADAIELKPYERHVIDPSKCTRCDNCRQVCPAEAVEIR